MRGQRIRLLLVAAALVAVAAPARAQGLVKASGSSDAAAVKDAGTPADLPPCPGHGCPEPAGYLVLPIKDGKGGFQYDVQPYYPQPGDILLYNYSCTLYTMLFWLVGTDTPTHAAIVIERPQGGPAILEVGPHSHFHAFTKVCIVDVLPRLASYPGVIMVRRPCHPLSPEKSAELTRFALAQDGKKFAVGRLALQITPFRCRWGLRRKLFARTCLTRERWICSENVVAAATVAGLCDPTVHFANAMYPRDLCYDEHYDLSASYCVPILWTADPHPHIVGNQVEFPTPPPQGD
jgi:hypothetical protein